MRGVADDQSATPAVADSRTQDTITGLANVQYVFDIVFAEAYRPGPIRDGPAMAMLMIEVDWAERVGTNDILSVAAERVLAYLRPGDVAARVGGRQFLVLLRGIPDVAAARMMAQRIIDVLAHPTRPGDVRPSVRATVGLAVTDVRSEVTSLFRQADTALYTAKAQGGGLWLQYHDGMQPPSRVLVENRRMLETILDEQRLTVHYQPIIELATGVLVGFEALLRCDPKTEWPTIDLIAVAESTGLIDDVGDRVMDLALKDLAALGPPDLAEQRFVGVNISPLQLQRPAFADTVRSLLARHSAEPDKLVLEITENVLVDDERAWAILDDLRRQGVRVAIDDYGTGHATLSYLRNEAIDIIKIDRSFLRDIESYRAQTLIQAVIRLAGDLGIDHVAEGIDTEVARSVLLRLGCRCGQGFQIAGPMPLDDVLTWCSSNAQHRHA